jgi:hypothetical protein
MSEWQDISTAPKDGTRFLAVVNDDVRFVYWGKTSHVPLYGFNTCDEGVENCDLCEPSVWMPLPPPPKAQ